MGWLPWLIVGLCHLMLVKSADVHYSVTEQSKAGLLVGNIPDSIDLVNLVSQASIPYMKYSFLSIDSNLRKYFSLNEKSGDLRLSSTEVLDREVVCQFDVTCNLELQIAIQSTHTQFFRKVLVSIDVIDINDHAPEFKENFTSLTISESVQIPSSFPLPSAIDKDTGINNSLQGYEIFPQDGPFELSYSKSYSSLMLRVVKELDHETRDLYSVKIVARDGGDPPREGVLNVDIIVEDINDNAPKFTQDNYAKVVDETVNQGSLLLTLKATDADSGKNGHLRYRLSPQQPAYILSMFSVDEGLGDLRLVGDFQNAETELYKIDVEASDMGDQPFTTKTTVSITVEDTINSRPKLLVSYLSQNNYSSISEYANLGVAVAHILVKDTDRGPNGIVQCNLTSGGYFELQSYDIKEYKVIVARSLDRESVQVHNVTIECVDAGLPSLSTIETFQVRVIDENDNAPTFPQRFYNMTIRENNEIGREILTVAAVDADDRAVGNGKITYSLQDVSNGQLLINPDTGVIKAMTSFDYELKRQINFTVVADDNGIPRRSAKVSVRVTILDENDQVPYFAQSRFTIAVSEYASRGDLIGEITAFDFEQGKNGQFEITQIPGSGRGKRTHKSGDYYGGSNDDSLMDYEKLDDDRIPFEIHHNGSLFLLRELDYEIRSSYEFEVRVTDKGEPPLSDTATVVIDVADENDNTPYILHPNASQVLFTALTGADAPRTLFSFEVLDRDSGSNSFLVYTVTARNDSGRFHVDSHGDVTRTRDFTYRDAGTYKLSVMVRDSGTPPLSDVRTFLIQVSGGNGTSGRSGLMNDQYIVIALTLVCVTILLSVTIVLIIVVMRRLDKRRKHSSGLTPRPPMHIQNSRVITTFMDPMKMDNFRHDGTNREYRDDDLGSLGGKKMNDSHFGFSSSSGSINKNGVADSGYQSSQVNNLNLPPHTPAEEDIDLEGLQLHHVLLESYQLDSHVASMVLEDAASDSSGETITSDSGRGGSDEDISNSNITSGNSMDGSRNGHNGSFQSCTSTFGQIGSLKSSVKDPIRSSGRKHVTFKETDRLRNMACSHAAAMLDKAGPHASSVSVDTRGTLCHLAGALQKQPLNTFTGVISTKEQNNLLSEMNIPVSIDNSNLNVDSPKYTSSASYSHPKHTVKEIPSRFNYADEHLRDSPRLMTFSSPASHQETFQNHKQAHNTLYNGEDSIPSPMPRESSSEWRSPPGMVGRDHPNAHSQQTYMAMNAPRDFPKSQQRSSHCRSPSPHVQQNSLMLTCDTSLSSGRGHYRNNDTPQETNKVNSFTNERHRGQYNSSKDNLNLNQTNSLTSSFSNCLRSSPLESPAPRLPSRETTPFNGPVLSDHSLQGQDPAKYPINPSDSKVVLPDHMAACSYDWTNDSIATTDDFDDQRSTTTSGSYTVDNEDDYLALEFTPKDVVV